MDARTASTTDAGSPRLTVSSAPTGRRQTVLEPGDDAYLERSPSPGGWALLRRWTLISMLMAVRSDDGEINLARWPRADPASGPTW